MGHTRGGRPLEYKRYEDREELRSLLRRARRYSVNICRDHVMLYVDLGNRYAIAIIDTMYPICVYMRKDLDESALTDALAKAMATGRRTNAMEALDALRWWFARGDGECACLDDLCTEVAGAAKRVLALYELLRL